MNIVESLRNSLRTDGLYKTILKVIRYPHTRRLRIDAERKRVAYEKMLSEVNSAEERFTWIYQNNYWGDSESVSGPGSTLQATANLRKELPKLIADFSVTTIFDAPCGDFSWMRHVLNDVEVNYIGGDIVEPLIKELEAKYGSQRTRFLHIDLTKESFPQADLLICRDLLFHLSFKDTRAVLQNFVDSDVQYFLTTTHNNGVDFVNKDIETGGYRGIDLFLEPYCFPADPLARISDWVPPHWPREMCLWSKDQVRRALEVGLYSHE